MFSNIFEFHHHLDPASPEFPISLAAAFHFEPAYQPGDTTLRFAYRKNLRARVTSASFQKTTSLTTPWSTATPSLLETLSTDPATGDPRMRAKFPITPGEISAFYRLKVSP